MGKFVVNGVSLAEYDVAFVWPGTRITIVMFTLLCDPLCTKFVYRDPHRHIRMDPRGSIQFPIHLAPRYILIDDVLDVVTNGRRITYKNEKIYNR